MEVTLSGMVMDVREEQYSNAQGPMEVTLSGMVMDVRKWHYENARSPIEVTLPSEGMTLFLHPATSVLLAVSIKQFPSL